MPLCCGLPGPADLLYASPMHPNAERIRAFYQAFKDRDAAAMGSHYAKDVRFSDPVFQGLVGDEARAMWAMLVKRGKDTRIEFKDIQADDHTGSASWDAWYTFSGTGRKVHNIIKAKFEFRNGEIVSHTDDFDLTAWIGQAFGVMGRALGSFGFFHNFVRKKARANLDAWMKGPPA